MYEIKFSPDNLVELVEKGIFTSVRPVFHEELDLLGISSILNVPRSHSPILWEKNGFYYFNGEKIAKVKPGGFFTKPDLRIMKKPELKPVNMEDLLRLNQEKLLNISERTLDRIHDFFKKHGRDFDLIVVSFSGGKDSIALLDLFQRVVPPDEFIVVFSDTTMELKKNVDFVEDVKEYFKSLKFYTIRSEKDATTTWKEFGPPSRIHRWCCSVHKSAPVIKLARNLTGKKNPRLLVVDGIRSSESGSRSAFQTLSKGKYALQKNFHPIIDWNSIEVFLYIFQRKLPLNDLYRMGMKRVGCVVCPLSSRWWDSIVGMEFKDEANEFLKIIRDFFVRNGIAEDEIEDFIDSGDWKARVSSYSSDGLRINGGIAEIDSSRMAYLYEWSKVLEYPIEKIVEDNTIKVLIRDPKEIKIAKKSHYCVRCGVCEAICPTGAIDMRNGKLKIDQRACTHCYECLDFNSSGCLRADSLKPPSGGGKVKASSYSRYKHFGIRKRWLEEFFEDPEKWWRNNTLGPVQFQAMKLWMNDAGVLKKNALTELGKELVRIGAHDPFVWGVIWNNLYWTSPVVNWYLEKLKWGRLYTKEELLDSMDDRYSVSSRKNGLQSLREILEFSPIGNELSLGEVYKKGTKTTAIKKTRLGKIDEKAKMFLVLYSLYDWASRFGYRFSLSELLYPDVKGGPWKIFGVDREELVKILRGFDSMMPDFVRVDIVADLENVHLNEKLSTLDVVREYR